jgi:hypothetical protein
MQWREEFIKEEAKRILEELNGGTLFGQPIDWTDLDTAIVAAYHAGNTKALMLHTEHENTRRELRRLAQL